METALKASPPPAAVSALSRSYRFETIDLLRGLVMIIMALDHTRDFFHRTAITEDPLSMQTTTPILFFTRWITHFCAPVFVFLAGTSGWFQSLRKSKKELSFFLITRGLWLVFMEITITTFLFSFDLTYSVIGLQTIWAIGISMLILGLVIWLPFPILFALGLLIVFGHNSLDFYEADKRGQPISFFYDLMHRVNFHPLWKGSTLLILYPFLSWTGLMILGYCFGKLFTDYEGVKRKKRLAWLGFAIIAFFIILRATNEYGDANHWKEQKNFLFTVLSFINTVKYPPSLLFMCMTIGPAVLFLSFLKNTKTKLARFIIVYGRVPFFYYLVHFLLLHLIATIVFYARGHETAEGINEPPNIAPNFVVAGEGVSLFAVYLIWIAVVISLYPLCKWYDNYKTNHREKKWLSYL